MTDEEKFQKTFDKLHASPDVLTEVLKMTAKEQVVPMKKKRFTPKAAAAIAAVVLAAGSGSAAYAMDVGGIQRIVQDGNDVSQGGGGVAYENGTERPLTADELLDEINMPEVEYEEDGTVWVYYLNQKMEITDKFEDGVCFVQLKADGQTQYITVKYQNGYATSPDGYIQPDKFN